MVRFLVDIDAISHKENKNWLRGRIEVDGDSNIWVRGNRPDGLLQGMIPKQGTYKHSSVAPPGHPIAGFNNSLVLYSAADTFPLGWLSKFFPAEINKQGGGHLGSKTLSIDGSQLQYRIVQGQSELAGLTFEVKFNLAMNRAIKKFPQRIPAKLAEMITDPLFWGFVFSMFYNKPGSWFVALRGMGLKALGYFAALSMAYTFCEVLKAIDAADSYAELDAAGDALTKMLADLGVDGIAYLSGAFVQWKTGRVKIPKTMEETTPPTSFEATSSPRITGWRRGHAELVQAADQLTKEADISRGLALYVSKMERAAGLRLQAEMMRSFVFETAHHMDWVERAAPVLDDYLRNLKAMINAAGKTDAERLGGAAAKLKTQAREVGYDMSDADALAMMKELEKAAPGVSFKLHDVETAATSKLNKVVSEGMMHPMDLRALNLSIDDLSLLAQGLNPRTRRRFKSPDEFENFFLSAAEGAARGKNSKLVISELRAVLKRIRIQVPQWLATYGSYADVGRVFQRVKHAIFEIHGAVAHHLPFKMKDSARVEDYLEAGVDTAHAMLQNRHYRDKSFAITEVIPELAASGMPQAKLRFVALGLIIFKRFDLAQVQDPRRVSMEALNRYGLGDLVDLKTDYGGSKH